ncbi:nucleotide pyrophosphohydrolase [Candidatus Hodarchaeum mangrovi]
MAQTGTIATVLVKSFIQRRNWTQYHTPKNLAMSIAIEAAELMELFQWYTIEESVSMVASNPDLRIKLEDEIADILIYCISLSERANLNLEMIIKKKLDRNENRFPVEIVSGKLGPYPSSEK